MRYINIANTFSISIEGEDNSAVNTILHEYQHIIYNQTKLPILGNVVVNKEFVFPSQTTELRKGILYEYEDALLIYDRNSIIKIEATCNFFKLTLVNSSDPTVSFYTLEMLIRMYVPSFGLVFLHAGAFKYKNKVCVINAFGGVGKTEVMIKALEKGAMFLSDDFAIFNENGDIFPYTKQIYLCEYPYDDYMLNKTQRSKVLFKLKKWCEHHRNFITERIISRLETHYFGIKIDYTLLTSTETPNKFYKIDSFYWADRSDKTSFRQITKEHFSQRMKLCLDIESRRYFDYDGYLRLKYPFFEMYKKKQLDIIDKIAQIVKVDGVTIKGCDYKDLAELIMKQN